MPIALGIGGHISQGLGSDPQPPPQKNDASIPATNEPPGLVRQDGKRPDWLTLIPWQGGKSLAWDVTVVSTLAQSYVDRAATGVGMVAELAAERKSMKYSNLPTNLIF